MTKPIAAASKGSGQSPPRKPSQSRIRSTALPRGELFCSAAKLAVSTKTSPLRERWLRPQGADGEGSLPTAHRPQLIYQFDILVCPHYRQRGKGSLIYQSKCRTCFFCAIDISVAFPFFLCLASPCPVCRLPPPGPKKPKFTNLLQISLFFLDTSQFSMQNVEVYKLHSFSAEVYSFQQ